MRTYRASVFIGTVLFVTLLLSLASSASGVSGQARKIPDSIIQSLRQWIAIGRLQMQKGGYADAAEAFQRAEEEAAWLGKDGERISSLMALGVAYWDLGELEKSRQAYKQAKSLAERAWLSEDEQKCRTALEIDRLYQKGKESSASKRFPKVSLALNKLSPLPASLAASIMKQSVCD